MIHNPLHSALRSLAPLALGLVALASCHSTHRTSAPTAQIQHNQRYVVVLSLDGFWAEYQNRTSTPALNKMDREGLSGRFRPCYPSLTFPNHYAMATGLYPDHHGIIANQFWTPDGKHYRLGDRKSVEDPSFYHGEPLWATAKRQGLGTASYFWVGSETAIGGVQPDRWKHYDASVGYEARADSVISWLSLPEKERPRLIMWYLDEPDHTGHHETPDSPKTLQMVRRVDSVVGYFRQRLAQLPIAKQTDFIVVADHGMAAHTSEKSVNLADYVPLDSFEHVATGPFTHLYPKAGYTHKAYELLKRVPHVQVYRRGELPERLHFGTNPSIGEIILIADIGTQIYFRRSMQGFVDKLKAGHGYDNQCPEMYALFKAVGPDFPAGKHISEPIPNITLYPLVCQLLGIQPAQHDADETIARSLHLPLPSKH